MIICSNSNNNNNNNNNNETIKAVIISYPKQDRAFIRITTHHDSKMKVKELIIIYNTCIYNNT